MTDRSVGTGYLADTTVLNRRSKRVIVWPYWLHTFIHHAWGLAFCSFRELLATNRVCNQVYLYWTMNNDTLLNNEQNLTIGRPCYGSNYFTIKSQFKGYSQGGAMNMTEELWENGLAGQLLLPLWGTLVWSDC